MQLVIVGIISTLTGMGVGIFGLRLYLSIKKKNLAQDAELESSRVINKAKTEAARIEKESKQRAKDFEIRARKNVESDIHRQKQKVKSEEQHLLDKERDLEKSYKQKEGKLEHLEKDLEEASNRMEIAEKRMKSLEKDASEKLEQLKHKLNSVSQMTAEEAKRELMRAMEDEAKHEAAKLAIQIEEETKEQAEKKAKKTIALAISRYAGEYTAERTVSVIALPNDEMKGKIIGREGRNIRALESACGVDLIVDDTPEAVVISGFDPVRREVAKRSLERLMEDGRIHPARIEEVVDKIKSELFKSIKDDGERACFDLGVHNLNTELIKLVGSLKYRTSYTQNNYTHSIEVGFLAGMMAAELGADTKQARRAGLLHDIGKALDHSIEGSHAVIGAEFAKKHGEIEAICHAIRAHHEDEPPNSVIAHLVQAADALSGARPGARRSMMESYIQRLEGLESIGNSFDGVLRTFALQAGREVRVIVEGSRVTDEQAVMLSRDVARKIERELKYPGQVKVTVIRETRAVEHAR